MMKTICQLFCLFVGFYLHASEPQKLIFAPMPLQNEENMFKIFSPMVHYLEKTLHVTISFHFSTSYKSFLEKIEENTIDIAYIGPLPYVELKKNASFVEPLVFFNEADGKPFYRCTLVAWGESYRPLSKLSPYHSFALTEPLSTCGYLSVSNLLREAGQALEEQPFSYLGRQDKVALSVVKGQFEYGGVKDEIAKTYAHLGLEVVAQTEPLPAFVLIANAQKLSPEFRNKITEALLYAPKSEYQTWGKGINKGVSLASDAAFDSVRILRLEDIVAKQGAAQ